MRALNLLANALIEAEWLAVGETPSNEEASFALSKLNDLLEEWSALKRYSWSMAFNLFTLAAGLSPHTIGPTGTFVTPYRPVRIENWSLFLQTSNPGTDVPGRLRDADWWARNRVKGILTSVPTDLYYQPTWPNGTLNFWPIPNIAYQVRLESWVSLAQLASVQTDISLPPGYRKALTLSLAEELDGPRSQDGKLAQKAAQARAAIQSNNAKSPRISSRDPGMAGTRKGEDFNWMTGEPV